MSISQFLARALFAISIVFAANSFAADANIDQVYQAAKAGNLDQAQAMMQQVLADHPNSAKAHFVEAELLAKMGRFESEQAELNNADRLAPGLPFAKAESVEKLRKLIALSKKNPALANAANSASPAANYVGNNGVQQAAPQAASRGFPWWILFVFAALIGFIVLAVKTMNSRAQQPIYMQNGGAGAGYAAGYGAGMPMQPNMGGGMMGGVGGGMGSGILGTLATGAALGAGLAAGEELVHHFTDGDRHNNNYVPPQEDQYVQPNDMGGNDFGIADSSSWDSGGGGDFGGGGDW